MLAYDLIFLVARAVVLEYPRAHAFDPVLADGGDDVGVVGPGVLAVVLRGLGGMVGVGMIEPQEVHVPLPSALLELLYARRLDEEAARTLLLVGVLRAPDVDDYLHLAHVHTHDGPGTLLG